MNYEDIERVNSEMKRIDIKGKDYAMVASRVQAFRKLYPEGFIKTRMHIDRITTYDGDGNPEVKRLARCNAEVGYFNENGTKIGLAIGHAEEIEGSSNINKTSFIENCETSAVGRALAFLGLGSTDDIASAEEVISAQGYDQISKEKAQVLRDLIKAKGKDEGYICKFHKVKKLEEMTARQYTEVVKWLGA